MMASLRAFWRDARPAAWAGWVLCGLVLAGCGGQPRRAAYDNILDDAQQSRSQLDQAYDMLARIDEFERGPATLNVISFLSGYLAEHSADPAWEADGLVSRLPRNLRQLPPLEQLQRLEVQPSDPLYLEEALLMRNIGAWVTRQSPPPELQTWLAAPESPFDGDAVRDLTVAYLLFDWTVRNIQLDHLVDTPKDVVGPVGQGAGNIPPPLRGLPGPGYMAYPWYVAMAGHGDAWQRARVFILLARQQGLDVVMLSIPDAADPNTIVPWACGVLIGEDLFLFDPAIGLPIPGPQGQGIATLRQVRDDGQLLRALDVDAEHLYEIASDQVKNVTAQIDGSLEALSQRMRILERGLAGDRQLKLAIDASELAARLRKSPGIANVSLWPVAIEATLFEAAFRESPQFDPQFRQSMLEERLLLEQRTMMSEARQKHLRGQLSSSPGEPGAKELYVQARIPDAEIEALLSDSGLQQKFGLQGELNRRRDPRERQAFLEGMQSRIRRGKQDCSYWLGLAHYDAGNYDSAITWFDQRTLKSPGENWWKPSAHYNLGRAYEALGFRQLAQEQYLDVESPARLGALIRARRLSAAAAP